MIKERTLTNLRNAFGGKVYVYLNSETIGRRFLEDAEKEGYRLGKTRPAQSGSSDIIALEHGKQLSFVGFVGHMAFQCPSGVSGKFYRVDYERYINGDENFFFSEKLYNRVELSGKFYRSVLIVGDNSDKAADEIQKRISDIDSLYDEEKLYDEISEKFDVSISEE